MPHAVLVVPATQVLPLQQPFGHVAALHGGWQTLPWQVPPVAAQFWHAWPPVPHEVFELPVTQVVPLQHPLGQFCGLHCGGGI